MLAAVTSNSQSSEVCCNKGLFPVHFLTPCGCRGHSQSWGNRLPMSCDPGPSAWVPSIRSLHPAGKKRREIGGNCAVGLGTGWAGTAQMLTPAHISLVRTQSPGLSWTPGRGLAMSSSAAGVLLKTARPVLVPGGVVEAPEHTGPGNHSQGLRLCSRWDGG